uniref:IF rod domain-containing protein n=1 Tax=Salvator merianae TaxID=96440 RepID=A0A8D0BRD1_SALMN
MRPVPGPPLLLGLLLGPHANAQGSQKTSQPGTEYSHTGEYSMPSVEGYGSGYSGGNRCSGFSSRSLGSVCCGRGYKTVGFSSQSVGGGFYGSRGPICGGLGYEPIGRFGDARGIKSVRINANLLRPLGIHVDPEISRVKVEEREQIKTLNDKFACFIDKVRHLEQHNKLLETKWNCLQQQAPIEKRTLDHLYENYIAALKRQLAVLMNEQDQLQVEQTKFHEVVEEYKFPLSLLLCSIFQDVDCTYTNKVELEVKVEALRQELEFLRCVHKAEIDSLQTCAGDTNVVVSMDNSRELDMEGIIESVRCQYEEIVQSSKDEVNALYETKYKDLQSTWGRHCEDVCRARREIQDLTRHIQRLKTDMENAKKQTDIIQAGIADNEQRGEYSLKDAKTKLAEVEKALQCSKDELARLLRDFQELLNVKLSLDIEIAMYKTLLEGEESSGRFSSQTGGFGYRSGYSSRSGGHISRRSSSSGFGQHGTSSVASCGPSDCVPVNAGCTSGRSYSSRKGCSSKSGACKPSVICIPSSHGPCGTSTVGTSCVSEGYTSEVTSCGHTTTVSSSADAVCITGDTRYNPGNECRVVFGGKCSIIR